MWTKYRLLITWDCHVYLLLTLEVPNRQNITIGHYIYCVLLGQELRISHPPTPRVNTVHIEGCMENPEHLNGQNKRKIRVGSTARLGTCHG